MLQPPRHRPPASARLLAAAFGFGMVAMLAAAAPTLPTTTETSAASAPAIGATTEAPTTGAPPATAARDHDPWIFRCVLDGNPRMVVLALGEALWVAYDARTCALHAGWSGDVVLQGSVYDAAHGPQPEIRGVRRLEGCDGATWSIVDADDDAGAGTAVSARWLGYRIDDGRAVLRTELTLPDRSTVVVEESPELVETEDGLSFDRRFQITEGAVPADRSIIVRMSTNRLDRSGGTPFTYRADAPGRRFDDGSIAIALSADRPATVRFVPINSSD